MKILPKLANKSPVAQTFHPVQAQAEACGYILQEALLNYLKNPPNPGVSGKVFVIIRRFGHIKM
jgi:hypothetical protein